MSAPEIGQIVEVRQRPWVVVDRAAPVFAPDAVRDIAEPQHLLTLSSIEDNGLGEELQVLWAIESSRHRLQLHRPPRYASCSLPTPPPRASTCRTTAPT